jgi:hypothetical protein
MSKKVSAYRQIEWHYQTDGCGDGCPAVKVSNVGRKKHTETQKERFMLAAI